MEKIQTHKALLLYILYIYLYFPNVCPKMGILTFPPLLLLLLYINIYILYKYMIIYIYNNGGICKYPHLGTNIWEIKIINPIFSVNFDMFSIRIIG